MAKWYGKKLKMKNLLDNPPESINFSREGTIEVRGVHPEPEVKTEEAGALMDPYEFGDTPGKLLRYEE